MGRTRSQQGGGASAEEAERPTNLENASDQTQQKIEDYSRETDDIVEQAESQRESRKRIEETLENHGESGSSPYRDNWETQSREQDVDAVGDVSPEVQEATWGDIEEATADSIEGVAPEETHEEFYADSQTEKDTPQWMDSRVQDTSAEPRQASIKQEYEPQPTRAERQQESVSKQLHQKGGDAAATVGDNGYYDEQSLYDEVGDPAQEGVAYGSRAPKQNDFFGGNDFDTHVGGGGDKSTAVNTVRATQSGVAPPESDEISLSDPEQGASAASFMGSGGTSQQTPGGVERELPEISAEVGAEVTEIQRDTIFVQGENGSMSIDPNSNMTETIETIEGNFQADEQHNNAAVEKELNRDGIREEETRESLAEEVASNSINVTRASSTINSMQYENLHPETVEFTTDIVERESITIGPWTSLENVDMVGGKTAAKLERDAGVTTVKDLSGMGAEEIESSVNGIGEKTAEYLSRVAERGDEVSEEINFHASNLDQQTTDACEFTEEEFRTILQERAKQGWAPEDTAEALLDKHRNDLPGEPTAIEDLEPISIAGEHRTVPNETIQGEVVQVHDPDRMDSPAGKDQYQVVSIEDRNGDRTRLTVWNDAVQYPEQEVERREIGMNEGPNSDLRSERLDPEEDVLGRGDKIRVKNISVNASDEWSDVNLDGNSVSVTRQSEVQFLDEGDVSHGAAQTSDPPQPPSYYAPDETPDPTHLWASNQGGETINHGESAATTTVTQDPNRAVVILDETGDTSGSTNQQNE